MKHLSLLLTFLIFIGAPYTAADAETSAKQVKELVASKEISKSGACQETTTASISVRLSETADSFKTLSDRVAEMRKNVMDEAEVLGLDDLKIKNSNFTIRPQNNRYTSDDQKHYVLSGTVNFNSKLTEKAIKLAETLSDKDFSVTYSENMRAGYCPKR